MAEKELTLEEVKQDEEVATKAVEEEENPVEVIKGKSEPVERILSDGVDTRKYIQRPLSYFGKLEFFSMIGETVDVALQTGLTVNTMLEAMPGQGANIQASDFADVDSFFMAIAKLTRYAPDLLKDCYCVWLNVPFDERMWAKQRLDEISDDEGIDIIETFLDQNTEAIENFIREKVIGLWKRAQSLRADSPQSSNNSKRTRRRTPKKQKI